MDITPEAPVILFGLPMEGWNVVTLLNAWLVMGLLVGSALVVMRSPRMVPGRVQVFFEMITEFFEEVCVDTLGPQYGRKFMPFITTLFVFVLICNVMGAIPNLLWWTGWPGFRAPTQDLNTPLGLALIVLFTVHICGIRVKGFRGWLWSFYEPSFPAGGKVGRVLVGITLLIGVALNVVFIRAYARGFGGMSAAGRVGFGLLVAAFAANSVAVTIYSVQLKRVPNVPMSPLNFVGELGKGISHPFRLFGNIFGGFVIVAVLSHLLLYVGLPPVLSVFFDVFVGVIQAFVFAMLALAYTAVQIRD